MVQIHIVIPFNGSFSFVGIDSASNFTHYEPEPGLFPDDTMPSGCLVILRERGKKGLNLRVQV